VGYATLYGDMCGGFALLKDLYKTRVYDLCNWINNNNYNSEGKNMIPSNIINKEPTAELKLNQKDSDSLPPYEILDQILEMLIDENKDLQSIINKGFKKGLVVKIWKMIKNSEFKRYQSAIGPKLTKMALANDRRFPITNKFEI
jgi:NAD+ synthetase